MLVPTVLVQKVPLQLDAVVALWALPLESLPDGRGGESSRLRPALANGLQQLA